MFILDSVGLFMTDGSSILFSISCMNSGVPLATSSVALFSSSVLPSSIFIPLRPRATAASLGSMIHGNSVTAKPWAIEGVFGKGTVIVLYVGNTDGTFENPRLDLLFPSSLLLLSLYRRLRLLRSLRPRRSLSFLRRRRLLRLRLLLRSLLRSWFFFLRELLLSSGPSTPSSTSVSARGSSCFSTCAFLFPSVGEAEVLKFIQALGSPMASS
mmetsp:Transcript_34897/g.56299  ORF Transcript_34897/g.56299 Transcript_34897/m.56299 type:complete len:212 (-) Transcript_34897:124-759(-)